ncbi:MAG: hypothetical protein EP330_10905 [Deltaproteobacteria bacterium]|nr:MAG: hypothetical protein EP330_10905 [Deltaproteobacteria bacterium]
MKHAVLLLSLLAGCATEEVAPFTTTAEPTARTMLAPGLADPDAYAEGSTAWFSGTWDGRVLPLYRFDASGLAQLPTYDPSAADPDWDYCDVWAPELTRIDGSFLLAFAGKRVPNGAACGPRPGEEQTIWFATADDSLRFGAPTGIDLGPGAPRTSQDAACPAEGCAYAMRIDISSFVDPATGDHWLSWTYFDGGNRNASVNLSNPTQVVYNTAPDRGAEGWVTEAPQIFERDGSYYFLYSADDFREGYHLRWMRADTPKELTKAQASVHDLTTARRAMDGSLLENAGHGSIFEFGGEWYAIYHLGRMSGGTLVGRDTVVSPVRFDGAGNLRPIGMIELTWDELPGADYSLDVITSDGRFYGPCVDANQLSGRTDWTYTGVCTSTGEVVDPAEIATYRLCHTTGSWAEATCVERAAPAASHRLHLPLDAEPVWLRNTHSGKCADMGGWSLDDGGNAIQWDCTGNDNQAWEILPAGDDVMLRNVHSGKCLDVASWSTLPGGNVQQYACHGGANQRWELEADGDAWFVRSAHSGLCIDVDAWGTHNGANLMQWTCHGGDNQLFTPSR